MKIGNFDLTSNKTFIVAELSTNHNGSLEVAKKSIKAAKQAGADAIKFQTYTADSLTLKSNNNEFKIKGGLWDGKYLYELYENSSMPFSWHEELFRVAKEEGIECFSTPFDKNCVDFLEKFDPVAYKIASYEVTDYELVRYTASKKKPIIISTGIATKQEIKDVVAICQEEKNNNIVLLKCTSSYPTPLEKANLLTITDMRENFEAIIGFSDHTLGFLAACVAVSLGAKIVEKHFILDKTLGGNDVGFSLNFDEFKTMTKMIRDTEKILGQINYDVEKNNRAYARSLYVCEDIKKGEVFTRKNVKSVRPFNGLHPKYLNDILGKPSNKDLDFATPLKKEFIGNKHV